MCHPTECNLIGQHLICCTTNQDWVWASHGLLGRDVSIFLLVNTVQYRARASPLLVVIGQWSRLNLWKILIIFWTLLCIWGKNINKKKYFVLLVPFCGRQTAGLNVDSSWKIKKFTRSEASYFSSFIPLVWGVMFTSTLSMRLPQV